MTGIDPFRPARIVGIMLERVHTLSAAVTAEQWQNAWEQARDDSLVEELLGLRTPFVGEAVAVGVTFTEADAAFARLVEAARLVYKTAGDLPSVHTRHGAARVRAYHMLSSPTGEELRIAQHELHREPLDWASAVAFPAMNAVTAMAGLIAGRRANNPDATRSAAVTAIAVTTQQDAAAARPRWDNKTKCLWFGGKVIRTYSRNSKRQWELLDAFEAAGWPEEAVTLSWAAKTIGDTVDAFNGGLEVKAITLRRDGTGQGVRWVPVS